MQNWVSKSQLFLREVDKVSIDEELNRQTNETGNITYTTDIEEGLEGADYVHTDAWVNMEFFDNGKIRPEFKKEYERKLKLFRPYQLNLDLIKQYAPNAKIMHCMPCHVGYEITRDAIDSKNSIIFDQAENRMHVEKAIVLWLLNKENLL